MLVRASRPPPRQLPVQLSHPHRRRRTRFMLTRLHESPSLQVNSVYENPYPDQS